MASLQYVRINHENAVCLYLETTDIFFPDVPPEKLEMCKRFSMSAFSKAKEGEKEGDFETWGKLFQLINGFFALAKDSDLRYITEFLITSNLKIKIYDPNKNTISNLLRELEQDLERLDNEIDLYNKFVRYCKANVPLFDMVGVGKRPQDSDKLTFYADEILQLLGVVTLSKMLIPLFSEAIRMLMNNKVKSELKELLISNLMNRILNNRCPSLIVKLKNYIDHNINKEFDEDMTAVNHGFTSNTLSGHIYSSLLVRNFVNVDPFKSESKLMVFINVSIRKNIDTRQKNMNGKKTMPRDDKSAGDEDSKRSKLEVDSLVSHHTGDTRPIVSAGLTAVIKEMINCYELDKSFYETVLAFNIKQAVSISPINRLVLYTFLGPKLGGARSISTMTAVDMARAITIVQVMSLRLGRYELAHAMVAKQGIHVRADFSDTDNLLRLNFKNSLEYRNVKERLETSQITPKQTSKKFVEVIQEIVESATAHVYIYDTCPAIYNLMHEDNFNGKQVQFTESLIMGTCELLELSMQY